MIFVTFCIGEHSKNKLIDKFLASQFISLEIKYTSNLTCVLTERKVEKENQQGKKERTGMIHMILNKMTQRVKKVGLFIAHMLKELFIVSPETLRQGLCKFWIYSTVTVFTTCIYFIILISMIAGNFVEIRLPKTEQKMSSEV